jgi:hypothetical protein
MYNIALCFLVGNDLLITVIDFVLFRKHDKFGDGD